MKVLWLSNAALSDVDRGETGTWLQALSRSLLASGEVELGNVTRGPVRRPVARDLPSLRQWVVPMADLADRRGEVTRAGRDHLEGIVREFEPDLVHVWGTESPWSAFTAHHLPATPALLEIQGLKGPCASVYAGGLTGRERLACLGVKELLTGRRIASTARQFERWGPIEARLIAAHRNVGTPSPWVSARVRDIHPRCNLFQGELLLREAFHRARSWSPPARVVMFCSAAYPAPFKGVHDALRALALVRRQFPEARLRVAGPFQARGLRQDGYVRWLLGLARSLGVSGHVDWLGPLGADAVVGELLGATTALMPSHCESYSVALAEAMLVGVPAVTAYTGGSSWLARDEDSALFFAPGDHAMCAWQVERLARDPDLALRIGARARAVAAGRHAAAAVVARQLAVYRQVAGLAGERSA